MPDNAATSGILRNGKMVDELKTDGRLTDPDIEMAFRSAPRHLFLPALPLNAVYQNEAVVTHRDETGETWSSSSQPEMMALMLVQLAVEPGCKVLEIGTGTGYNAAVMASLTQDQRLVYSVEVEAAYTVEAHRHLDSAGFSGVNVLNGDGWDGWPEFAPYNRIIVTAGSHDISPAWFDQLADGGRIVLPWALSHYNRCLAFEKRGGVLELDGNLYCGFMRMRGKYDWQTRGKSQAPHSDQAKSRQAHPPLNLPDLAPIAWQDLAFVLSLYLWPQYAVVGNPESAHPSIDVIDHNLDRRRMIRYDGIWNIIGHTDAAEISRIETILRYWNQAGRPSAEQLQLTASLRAPDLPRSTSLDVISREWFDYRVSWRSSA